jgi:hypothetical protein
VRRGKLWAKDMGYSEVLLGTWGTSWGIHWELEAHHWEHMKIDWEHDGNTRIKKFHPLHTAPPHPPIRKKRWTLFSVCSIDSLVAFIFYS